MIERLMLSEQCWYAMRSHVQSELPLEACGLLAGKGEQVEEVIPVHNIAQSPICFRMEPREQWLAFQKIETLGMDLIGIYHSHTTGSHHPSLRDIKEAMYQVVHVIWKNRGRNWQAYGFWIEAGQVTKVTLELINIK